MRKHICNHNTDWHEIAYTAVMAYNLFPCSSTGEGPFYLMFGYDTLNPTLFKLLLPKLDTLVTKMQKFT